MKTFMDRIDWLAETGGNPQGFFDTLFSDFLGPVAAFAGGALFPYAAIPAEIAGGFAGGTLGGIIGGKTPGQSLIQGAETGAIAGATGFLGQEAGVSPSSIVGDVLGTGGATDAGALAPIAGAGGAPSIPAAATPAAAPTGIGVSPPGGGAAGIVGGLSGDPNAILGASGGTNFLGAVGDTAGGGAAPAPASSISGPDAGGTFLAPGPNLQSTGPGSFFDPSGGTPAVPSYPGGAADVPQPGGGVSDFLSKHWPALASAGILGYQGLTANKPLPQETALQANATQAAGQAAALEAPLQTGILPPGAQQAVNAATSSQKAGIKSTYANLGLSGSTMEAQAIGAVDRNAAAQTFQIADSLLAKGIDLSKLSAADLTTLIDEQLRQDAAFTGALSSFAGGLAGGRLAA